MDRTREGSAYNPAIFSGGSSDDGDGKVFSGELAAQLLRCVGALCNEHLAVLCERANLTLYVGALRERRLTDAMRTSEDFKSRTKAFCEMLDGDHFHVDDKSVAAVTSRFPHLRTLMSSTFTHYVADISSASISKETHVTLRIPSLKRFLSAVLHTLAEQDAVRTLEYFGMWSPQQRDVVLDVVRASMYIISDGALLRVNPEAEEYYRRQIETRPPENVVILDDAEPSNGGGGDGVVPKAPDNESEKDDDGANENEEGEGGDRKGKIPQDVDNAATDAMDDNESGEGAVDDDGGKEKVVKATALENNENTEGKNVDDVSAAKTDDDDDKVDRGDIAVVADENESGDFVDATLANVDDADEDVV